MSQLIKDKAISEYTVQVSSTVNRKKSAPMTHARKHCSVPFFSATAQRSRNVWWRCCGAKPKQKVDTLKTMCLERVRGILWPNATKNDDLQLSAFPLRHSYSPLK